MVLLLIVLVSDPYLLQYAGECYCGKDASVLTKASENDCNMACKGNASEMCGGPARLSVYTQSTTTATTGPAAGWSSVGCFEDSTGTPVLNGADVLTSATMTPLSCTQHCNDMGFIVAGVEYGGECYCGNALSQSYQTPDGECNMPCSGAASEMCGAGNRLSVFIQSSLHKRNVRAHKRGHHPLSHSMWY
ncbi:WSC-domain-containing protein [Dacryopinax primogenitus]|uniref:WSC-domain-containing protein n=1 Tax=Dacryopinax primogenitus (strain DJM 731) TaxID=1858805 RepID=M5FZY9_DACPD|nr:WSC-domain-containing protein [Dacryopinax primogenitus]EJT97082.1 WSC-domain-containing protein [Dacryopinax primogenitus]